MSDSGRGSKAVRRGELGFVEAEDGSRRLAYTAKMANFGRPIRLCDLAARTKIK